jgi:hypothetical protein
MEFKNRFCRGRIARKPVRSGEACVAGRSKARTVPKFVGTHSTLSYASLDMAIS